MDFKLSKLEQKQIQNDYKQLTTVMQLPFAFYEEGEYEPGYGDSTASDWSEYIEYQCTPEEVSELNLKRSDFSTVEEGDLVIFIPPSGDFINQAEDSTQIKVKYQDREYITQNKPFPVRYFGQFVLYYVVVFKR